MKEGIVTELITWQEKFLVYLLEQKKMAKHTIHSYKLDLDGLIYFVEKNQSNHDIPSALLAYNLFLLESNLSKASIARKTSCLRTLCRFFQSEGISVDVTLKRPFFEEKKPVFFSYDRLVGLFNDSLQKGEQMARFYIRERAIWELLLSTGIRCNEIISLKMNDLDLDMKHVVVLDSKSRKRIISFDERTYEWLQRYVQEERDLYKPKEPYLFLNNFGKKLTSRAIQRSLKLLVKLVDIPDEITPHTVRHSYAMYRLSQGINHELLKELLGLRSAETVEKYMNCVEKKEKIM